tara:strand:- start:1700 stop:2947 length:1248 start_codon:yes stop_codon:yes gene_type:complete
MLKIIHLSESDNEGGAARAAFRINNALNNSSNIRSILRVNKKSTENNSVKGSKKISILIKNLKCYLSVKLTKLQKTTNPILHSISIFPSLLDKELNNSIADIIHLHWVQGEMISIEEIGRITKPIVWTMHDSWPFCGSEHHPNGLNDLRYVNGYKKSNKSPLNKGLDLDRVTWERKVNNWKNSIFFVAPSNWLAACAKKSKLLSDAIIKVIPHPLSMDVFKPSPKNYSRNNYDLPLDKCLILFGSLSSYDNDMKGWSIFESTISLVSQNIPNLGIVIFGSPKPIKIPKIDVPIFFIGRVYDDENLSILYSAVDVIAIPSKIESFGLTASEAQSCGTPVVAFNATGLKDIVEHKKTGYLATPFISQSFARGIIWVLRDKDRLETLSHNSRKRALKLWSNEVISKKYKELYLEIIQK